MDLDIKITVAVNWNNIIDGNITFSDSQHCLADCWSIALNIMMNTLNCFINHFMLYSDVEHGCVVINRNSNTTGHYCSIVTVSHCSSDILTVSQTNQVWVLITFKGTSLPDCESSSKDCALINLSVSNTSTLKQLYEAITTITCKDQWITITPPCNC